MKAIRCILKFFQKISSFCEQHHTFAAYSKNEIMDHFRCFCSRDMLLEVNRVLGNSTKIKNTE